MQASEQEGTSNQSNKKQRPAKRLITKDPISPAEVLQADTHDAAAAAESVGEPTEIEPKQWGPLSEGEVIKDSVASTGQSVDDRLQQQQTADNTDQHEDNEAVSPAEVLQADTHDAAAAAESVGEPTEIEPKQWGPLSEGEVIKDSVASTGQSVDDRLQQQQTADNTDQHEDNEAISPAEVLQADTHDAAAAAESVVEPTEIEPKQWGPLSEGEVIKDSVASTGQSVDDRLQQQQTADNTDQHEDNEAVSPAEVLQADTHDAAAAAESVVEPTEIEPKQWGPLSEGEVIKDSVASTGQSVGDGLQQQQTADNTDQHEDNEAVSPAEVLQADTHDAAAAAESVVEPTEIEPKQWGPLSEGEVIKDSVASTGQSVDDRLQQQQTADNTDQHEDNEAVSPAEVLQADTHDAAAAAESVVEPTEIEPKQWGPLSEGEVIKDSVASTGQSVDDRLQQQQTADNTGSLGNRCLTGVTWATRKRAVISKSLLSAAALRYYFISERTITNRVWTPHIRANIFDVENVVSDQKEEEDQLPQNLHLRLGESRTARTQGTFTATRSTRCATWRMGAVEKSRRRTHGKEPVSRHISLHQHSGQTRGHW